MTEAATRFVQPLTFAALTGHKVITSLWDDPTANEGTYESSIEHIGEAQWTEALVVAPATANILAKFAHGIADDFLTTMYLATTGAGAGGSGYEREHVEPSGDAGQSRHSAPARRARHRAGNGRPGLRHGGRGTHGRARSHRRCRSRQSLGRRHDLAGEIVLVTAGGTREALDPVRFLGNRSSGKMGYALAEAAQSRGAKVILVSGPTALHPPARCEVVQVTTAEEMRDAVLERMDDATMVIKAAAVADYRPVNVSDHKLKRTGPMTLELAPTEDILAEVVRQRRPGQLIVGFAAETEEPHGKRPRQAAAQRRRRHRGQRRFRRRHRHRCRPQCRDVSHPSTSIELPEMPKRKLADRILDEILALRRPRPLVV